MQQGNGTWTRAHDLALIYTALGYGTDKQLADAEITSIKEAVSSWRPEESDEAISEIVMEAIAVILEGDADDEVARSIRSLKEVLTIEQRRKALEDAVRIAEADGVFLDSERSLITVLAEIWEVEPTHDRLMEESTVDFEEEPLWSLLHDMALLYIVVAHGSDNKLQEAEIGAMIMRLGVWQPAMDEAAIREIIREALQFYATGPSKDDLDESATSIMETLSRSQRLELLNDLAFIAEADGEFTQHEKDMIELLAGVWAVDINLRGESG
ncbi:MAG: TerB family tellurite resistance protein [Rhodothermia bacterium]|nr:MAG: TerB family tellurite resistance protein [Rhodothermia bacterium]